MVAYAARRIVLLIPTLIGVSLLIFGVMKLIPGDPAEIVGGMDASDTDLEAIRRRLGLDQPLHVQYLTFVGGALRGDFGESTRSHRPVTDELRHRLPETVKLAVVSMVIATMAGVMLGIFAALRPYSLWDNALMAVAISGVSTPVFWLGLMLILLFSVQLRWLPTSGSGGPQHLVLPAITLAAGSSAIIARQMRADLIEVMHFDYIRTARAKGLAQRLVVGRHAIRNALIPTVTVVGLQFGNLLAGAVITETVFAWPGLGRLLVDAIKFRDFPVVQATILILAAMFVFVNLAVDLLYFALDPRIRMT
ncbi:MAG: ABC transporter permease [Chloroflexota bacterium]|nr:ABC transporter permease [Chloroflexota bacterium]